MKTQESVRKVMLRCGHTTTVIFPSDAKGYEEGEIINMLRHLHCRDCDPEPLPGTVLVEVASC